MGTLQYEAPTSIGEAVALLAQEGDHARPLAGGTSLLQQLYHGLIKVDLLVDVKGIPELNVLQFDPAGGLTIGAAVPCWRIYADPDVAAFYPCLAMAARLICSISVEELDTLGGNLCAAAAESDAIPALIALEAICHIAGPQGPRAVPMEKLWVGPGRTTLGRGEMLVSIHLPVPQPHSGAWYIPFYPCSEMDTVFVRVAAALVLNEGCNQILRARVALGAVAPTPLLLDTISAVLAGQAPSATVMNTAAALARIAADADTEASGYAGVRAQMVGLLTRRALGGALIQAREIGRELHPERTGLIIAGGAPMSG